MIRFDKFTQKALEATQLAQTYAGEQNHSQLQPELEHLLSALTQQKGGIVLSVLERLAVDVGRLVSDLASAIGQLPYLEKVAEVSLSRKLFCVFEAAQTEAAQLKDEYVSTEHLLIALSTGESDGVALLKIV